MNTYTRRLSEIFPNRRERARLKSVKSRERRFSCCAASSVKISMIFSSLKSGQYWGRTSDLKLRRLFRIQLFQLVTASLSDRFRDSFRFFVEPQPARLSGHFRVLNFWLLPFMHPQKPSGRWLIDHPQVSGVGEKPAGGTLLFLSERRPHEK